MINLHELYEENVIKQIKKKPELIRKIPLISEMLQIEIVKIDGALIQLFNEPCYEACLLAVKQNPDNMIYIENQDVVNALIKEI